MKLRKTASVIGLYSYQQTDRHEVALKGFYEQALQFFGRSGIVPTYIGMEGDGFSGDFRKFNGRQHKKAIADGFSGIDVLSIVANPDGSDEPAYDNYASLSLGFYPSDESAIFCLCVNEEIVEFGGATFDDALEGFVGLLDWDYGFGLSDEVTRQPDLYVLGMDNGRLSSEERSALRAWYAAPPEKKKNMLRDVYPYNILNNAQLSNVLPSGATLREFIEQQPGSSFAPLLGVGLFLWRLGPEAQIDRIRVELRDLGVLIR